MYIYVCTQKGSNTCVHITREEASGDRTNELLGLGVLPWLTTDPL